MKTVQELFAKRERPIKFEAYTQIVTSHKRAAQSKLIRMMISSVGQNADEMNPQKAQVGF